MQESKIIEIDSFNPYEELFPNRKVITKDTLQLIKYLRTEGYEVIVKPKDNRPVEYLFKKGNLDFLSDPTVQLLISIPVSIATGLITNWVQKKLDKKKYEANNIIIVNNSNNVTVNVNGRIISKGELGDIKKKQKNIKSTYTKSFKVRSELPGLPIPIFLNHTPKIIGWCRIATTDKGLAIEKGIITDNDTHRKMKQGKFKGCSITGIATKSICTICNSDFVSCNHILGNSYSGKKCGNDIVKADIIEISIVKVPINTATFIKFI